MLPCCTLHFPISRTLLHIKDAGVCLMTAAADETIAAQVLASLQLLDRLRQLATAEDPDDFALGYVSVLQASPALHMPADLCVFTLPTCMP